jgi:hypothetical protein
MAVIHFLNYGPSVASNSLIQCMQMKQADALTECEVLTPTKSSTESYHFKLVIYLSIILQFYQVINLF